MSDHPKKIAAGVFRLGHLREACALVKRYHYSGRVPGSIQLVATLHEPGGLSGDFGGAIAALFFSMPSTRWNEKVWELTRLVRHPGYEVQLTGLISRAVKAAKIDLIVSYADRTQKHHGGVYQAASWNYHGARKRRMDGVLIDGVFHPGRSCNSRWGTQSPARLTEKLGIPVIPHYDEGKHLYWKAKSRSGVKKAERLHLERKPYPKEFGG